MIQQLQRTMRRHGMLPAGAPLWVAVSGGVDSMVLLHALHSSWHTCHVVHVDHGLRGAESDADRDLVRAFCAQRGIPFVCERVDVQDRMQRTGESLQMAARALRLEVFHGCVERGPSHVAMAHHQDDVIETYFLHHLRGMGVRGWEGIPPVTGPFIRPLYDVGRDVIMAYAQRHAVPFRNDASNDSLDYLRNRVRHELLPLVEDLRAGSRKALGRDIELLGELAAAAEEQARSVLRELNAGAQPLRIPIDLVCESKYPHLLLRIALERWTPHPQRLDDILAAVHDRATGKVFPLGAARLVVDRHAIVVQEEVPSPQQWSFASLTDLAPDVPLRVDLSTWEEVPTGRWGDTVWLDADRLVAPLELRTWRAGDRMRPAGLSGSKLISDLLTNAKVPADAKRLTRVLVCGEEIVWLCGLRVGEGFQARPESTRVLRVTLC